MASLLPTSTKRNYFNIYEIKGYKIVNLWIMKQIEKDWSKVKNYEKYKLIDYVYNLAHKAEVKFPKYGITDTASRDSIFLYIERKQRVKAINRKLNRLGLVFFKINKPKIIQIKCSKCGKIFYANSKYYNQTTNKMDKCLDCSLEYNKGYNQRNRDKMLKYYRQWYQEFRKGGNHNEKKK